MSPYTIDSYDPTANTVTILETTARSHAIGETFFVLLGGLQTNENNSYIKKNATYRVWLHEMLHQEIHGNFPHVSNEMGDATDYVMNVMYPYPGSGPDNKNNLCGRPLLIHIPLTGPTHDRQWYRFHNP